MKSERTAFRGVCTHTRDDHSTHSERIDAGGSASGAETKVIGDNDSEDDLDEATSETYGLIKGI